MSAVALSEKVPDPALRPALRPHGFTLRTGELMDLEETALELVAAGYERVDQVEDSRSAAGCSTWSEVVGRALALAAAGDGLRGPRHGGRRRSEASGRSAPRGELQRA